ncbi:cAMP-binding domain of CRP or a regulatory subunit of cAMP-dependent protein kinases [Modicisalibacter xianhensis]|uniref:cAMP-binding domain of CRP or a regulatory subunit of cAMP-dependent protein kinases n=1 Tax=Modicisalibacter xianhensis TaxID=442341 RepID=A0A1I3DTT5_9GAMM|nr:Crp/Fnr family transcriptional regulator [Halomonas xianhensis]SFH90008.1 cAMP-binding domain of CRP or a regulatory subunit of cAMP-dependent protein kinases [Halomonas xianhensis]
MNLQDSAIVQQFQQHCSLTEEEKVLLLELEQNPLKVNAGDIIWQENSKVDQFCTISQGWAYSFRNLGDGSRQILKVYLPGDIIGMRDFAFSNRLAGVAMIEEGIVSHFSHEHLLKIFRHSTALTAGLFAIACRQQAVLTERLIYLARRTAQQRLAHFLYEMYLRLGRIGAADEGRFRLPLSQEQLGDILGLSAVHVSRTFTAFREDGLVLRDRHRVTLPDPEALAQLAEFDGGYLNDAVPALFFDREWQSHMLAGPTARSDEQMPGKSKAASAD